MNLGEKLKLKRKENHMTLANLSKETSISVSFLSDIENGRSNPSIENLKVISKVLKTNPSYFLDDNDSSTKFFTLLNDDELASILKDYSNWSLDDKLEFSSYIKAKNIIRNQSKS